jgi:hypothetical protein
MASSLDFSALPAKLKDYALSDNYQILTRLLVDGLGFTSYMQMLLGNDEIPLSEMVIGDILQPGNKDTFAPIDNAIKFKARIGKVRPCKVDLQFKPTQIANFWKSYLGKIARSTPESPYDVPFEAFLLDQIIKKAQENLRMKAVFKGVYNAAGTTPADTMTGLLALVAAAITDLSLPAAQISTGAAITASNAVDEVRKVIDKVYQVPAYTNMPMIMLIAPENKWYYEQDYQATFGALPYNTSFDKPAIEGTNIRFQAEPGMSGSDRLIVTPEENLFWLVDDEQRQNTLEVEKALRNLNLMMDFNAAPDFGIAELIWCNDQA